MGATTVKSSQWSRPPSRLRRYGAASFAFIHERRMVDQNIASWNPVISWLRRIERLKFAE